MLELVSYRAVGQLQTLSIRMIAYSPPFHTLKSLIFGSYTERLPFPVVFKLGHIINFDMSFFLFFLSFLLFICLIGEAKPML